MTIALLGTAIVLILLSALLSAVEAAVFGVSASHLRTLEEEGFEGATSLAALRAEPVRLRTALVVLNTFGNTGAMAVAATLVTSSADPKTLWILLPALAVGTVIVGELAPRLLAARRPVRLALAGAPALLRLERGVRPFLAPVLGLQDRLERGEGGSTAEARELREITELGREEGVVEEDENVLVERAFRLDELTAWDVMTPRVDLFAWKDSLTLSEIIEELRHVPYSRVPVYGESVDDVTGILYVREAYETYVAGQEDVPLSRLSRDPLFVPGSISLTRLLRNFQARRIHMGVVADEFGGTDGIVTMEDVLEELVGEIHDETDVEEEGIIRISRNELVVSGSTELREINYVFNVSLPHMDHRSLNGYILDELGRVPTVEETLEREGVLVEVMGATETQVTRARLTRRPSPADVSP